MLDKAILRRQHQEVTQAEFDRLGVPRRQICRLCRTRWPCDVIQLLDALEAAEREVRDKAASGCPCAYTDPCQKQCTCANPASSVGCARCCSYGSVEQRKLNAQRMEEAERSLGDLAQKVNALLTEIPRCRCHEDYRRIGREDPGCPYHEIGAEVIKDVRDALGKVSHEVG